MQRAATDGVFMKRYFFGKTKITVSALQKNYAMNVILINCLCYQKADILKSGELEITIPTSAVKRFESVFEDNGITASFGKSEGFFAVIERYKGRAGIVIGLFILVLSVFTSSKFVWRIDVSGNNSVSDEKILECLEKSGFGLGTFIPSVNYDRLHNRFLMECSDISWISVNIDGNVANVLVRERSSETTENKKTYTNVVAKYDAQIALITLYNGEKTVSVGDIVHKGDVLISGVIDSKSQGVRYVHADGIVNAYVYKTLNVKIPFKTTEKVYTGKAYNIKNIKIFSKTVNFLSKYNNRYEFCDTIETRKRLKSFTGSYLPIETVTKRYIEYEYRERVYTPEEAVDIAFSRLRQDMDEALENATLVSKSVSTSFDDEYFYIECNLYCLEDIAKLVEFQTDDGVS